MSCDGERRKVSLGYGGGECTRFRNGEWAKYSSYLGVHIFGADLPMSERVYRRKCDKPPMEWVLARLKYIESWVGREFEARPVLEPGDVFKVEEIHPKRWKVWRR
jgi:hypothetical protein